MNYLERWFLDLHLRECLHYEFMIEKIHQAPETLFDSFLKNIAYFYPDKAQNMPVTRNEFFKWILELREKDYKFLCEIEGLLRFKLSCEIL